MVPLPDVLLACDKRGQTLSQHFKSQGKRYKLMPRAGHLGCKGDQDTHPQGIEGRTLRWGDFRRSTAKTVATCTF